MRNVWVVDDDEEVRTAMQLMVRLMGFQFQSFPSAVDAHRALSTGAACPDMFFLDISMPGMTGLELLEYIRANDQWVHVPVLMLTSESSDVMVEHAIRSGADGYVFKPVNMDELRMAIRTAIERRRIKKTGPLGR